MKIEDVIRMIATGENEVIEFKESVGTDLAKKACAFANTSGGTILIGVDDKGNIVGTVGDISQRISDHLQDVIPPLDVRIHKFSIEKKIVFAVEVEKSPDLHSIGNICYVRIGRNARPLSLSEAIEMGAELLKINFDELPCRTASTGDLKKEHVDWFLKRRKAERNLQNIGTLSEDLRRIKAVVKERPSNGGILFFSKDPEEFIPGASLRIVEFESDNMLMYKDAKEFRGPVWKIADEAYEYLEKKVRIIGGIRVGTERREWQEYPVLAIREAIINALIHRNYFLAGDVRVYMFPDRIEIRNPGAIPSSVDLESPEHVPRNPLLCKYMQEIRYIEKYGMGILLMRGECEKHPLVDLNIAMRGRNTVVSFVKSKDIKLGNTEQKIIEALKEPTRSGKIAKIIGVSKPTTLKMLETLEVLGLVEKRGKGKSTVYARKHA